MLAKVVVLAIITLSIFGCSQEDNSSKQRVVTISDAESVVDIVIKSAKTSISFSNIDSSTNRSREFVDFNQKEVSCKDGGSITQSGGYEVKDQKVDYFKLVMDIDECIEDGLTNSGKIIFENRYSENSIKLSFLDNFSVTDSSKKISTIDDKSFIEIKYIDRDSMDIRVDMISRGDNLVVGSRDLVHRVDISNDYISFYPKSGVDGVGILALSVDKDYDASKTPMEVSIDGEFYRGGKFRYISLGSKIELEATGKNLMVFRVDSNRDGEFDNSETIEVAIVDGKAVAKKKQIDESTPDNQNSSNYDDGYNQALDNAMYANAYMFANNMMTMNMSIW